jgi:hypothetical protein
MGNKEEFDEMLAAMRSDKAGNKNNKFWSPPSDKEGTFPVRILPKQKDKGEKVFYFKHRVHWINKKSYECLDQSLNDKNGDFHEAEDCPVCKFVKKLYDTSTRGTEEWDLAGSMRAQDRYIYRIVVRGKEDETQPEYYETGKTIFEILFHLIAETDFGDITNLKEGRDFIISKKGVGRLAKYETSSPAASPTQVFQKVDDLKSLVEKMKQMDYSSLIEFTESTSLKKTLQEFISGDSDDEVPAPRETSRKTESAPAKAAAKPAPKPADDDDAINDILAEFEN